MNSLGVPQSSQHYWAPLNCSLNNINVSYTLAQRLPVTHRKIKFLGAVFF